MRYFQTIRPLSLSLASLAFMALAGCGSSTATVKGKVTSKGTALTTGNVSFHGANTVKGGGISSDGSYTVAELPPGDYKVAIVVNVLKLGATPPTAGKVPKGVVFPGKPADVGDGTALAPVLIDAKYKDAKTSGLSYTVQKGTQTIDIDLK